MESFLETFAGMAYGIELQDAPAEVCKYAVWDHRTFRVTSNDGGQKVVDKSTPVCEHCAIRVGYAHSNTSNMSARLHGHPMTTKP